MKFYTDKQVENLLNQILEKIPIDNHKFISLRKFIIGKKKHISEHI